MATSSESIHPAGTQLLELINATGYYDLPFGLVVKFTVNEGKEDELLEVIKLAVPESRKEKGVIQYDISRDLKDPMFVIIEKYENGAVFENHMRQSYTKALLNKIGEVSSGPSINVTSLIV